jgi:uncharacterized membrane protein
MVTVVSLYIVAGLVLAGVAVPLARRQIRPNSWYGFRTQRTLADPVVWYDANEYSGRVLVRAGFATAALAIALLPIAWFSPEIYAFSCLVASLASIAVAVIASFRYLRSLPRRH